MSEERRSPYLWAEELRVLFHYQSMDGLYRAIREKRFPVKTFKMANRIVADREAVKEYFRRQRAEALESVRGPSDPDQ